MFKISFIAVVFLLLSCREHSESKKDWAYKVNYQQKRINSNVNMLGEIGFFRTKPVEDKTRKRLSKSPWHPSMDFQVYDISNLRYCQEKVIRTKQLSSCVEPNVGGFLIIVNNYILLNRSVCTNCIGTYKNTDFCRPFLKELLKNLKLEGNSSLKDIDIKIGLELKRLE